MAIGPKCTAARRKCRMLEQTILVGKDGIDSWIMIQANE